MIIPLNNNVLVKRLEAEEKTSSGILLTDAAQEKQDKGIVLAIHKNSQVEVDQTVPFNKYGPVEIEVDGEELLLVDEEELLAILT